MTNLAGFQIKVAKIQDTGKVISLLKDLALWMRESGIKQWGYLLEGGDDEEIEQSIVNGETYLVLKDTQLVGTFTLLEEPSEWDRHVWGSGASIDGLYLHRLALHPSFMNIGLGSSLLNWIESNRYDIELIRLDCVSENSKLNRFYKENGFEWVGTEDGHSKYEKKIRS
ncbi:GNAT family N-acetyltransferase [Cytobacillus suaedae]|nr:GNAT family N-acetyltransferase [Cytobacillus suaedae]